jgi:two-component system, OmpR family, sensor histidine kinase MprB
MSLRLRIAAATALAVAVAVAAVSLVAWLAVRDVLGDQLDDSLRSSAAAADAVAAGTVRLVPVEGATTPSAPFSNVQVVRRDGSVSRPFGGEPFPPDDRATAVATGQREPYFSNATVDGTGLRIYTYRYDESVAIQIARSTDEVDATLDRLRIVLLAVVAGGVALGLVLGRLIAATAVAPVQRLSEATGSIALTGDLSHRIDAHGRDELADLARSFNAMLDSLEELRARQRQLVADASHELRTPLASLRTNIEVLQREHDPDPEDRARLLADLTSELEELTGLVADLVELARGHDAPTETEVVVLDGLVTAAVERARRHRPDLVVELDAEPCEVVGVPSRLDRAVSNLLDNAAKWNPPERPVLVTVTSDGLVRVRDHGGGIAATDLPHVFERFYRAPAARRLPGSGLGLAIVRQVAELHGGAVTVENAVDGGAVFEMRIPTAATPPVRPTR